jgi:hypothetical protein
MLAAGYLCRNENTHIEKSRNTDEDDDIWSQFCFFFIQSPSISLNKTVVIKTMISDITVFRFQHCDHQLTLVIIVQLPRLPVDVFVSLRLGLMSVLGKHHCFLCLVNLDKFIRTMCFSVNSSFICCNFVFVFLFVWNIGSSIPKEQRNKS